MRRLAFAWVWPLLSLGLGGILPSAEASLHAVRPLIEASCLSCHGPQKQKGELNLATWLANPMAAGGPAVWRSVISQVRNLEMPPENAKRPLTETERTRLVTELRDYLRTSTPSDPGRVTLRRLNRSDYDNTIRDLVGVDLRLARDTFPPDDIDHGFDNIGDILSVPPLLLEKYYQAAGTILDQAIVQSQVHLDTTAAQLPAMIAGQPSAATAAPGPREFTGKDEVQIPVAIPVETRYLLKARVGADQAGTEPAILQIVVDQQVVKEVQIVAPLKNPVITSLQIPLTKGRHLLALRFANPFTEPPAPDKPGIPPRAKKSGIRKLGITTVEVASRTLIKMPESHQRIFIAQPGPELTPEAAARRIIERFAGLAFRRPVDGEHLDRLTAIFRNADADGETFEVAVRYALQAVLVSPAFLYRFELDRPANRPGNAYALDDYELASRLSYFLWSSMPDSELFQLAAKGALGEPKMLAAQVQRMLKSPKSAAFSANFAEQWLAVRALATLQFDPRKYPQFTPKLRLAMADEPVRMFDHILREDRSVLEFIDADYAFMNEALAKHYGIAGVSGPSGQKVRLADRNRGGVMTMAAVLAVTSHPGRTSPVKRGKWVLEQILGQSPPPPPAAVAALPEPGTKDTTGLSLRQLMERHRTMTACASCHATMDTIGFGMENFDPLGQWRMMDGALPVDAQGTLPGGVTFAGPTQLKAVLLARKDEFVRNLAEKLLIYALGRGPVDGDASMLDAITTAVINDRYRFSSLVTQIVLSPAFRHRRLP